MRHRSYFLFILVFSILAVSVRSIPRVYAQDITVTSTADSGNGTLREAIDTANATTAPSTITLDTDPGEIIVLESPITINDPELITIDGVSQTDRTIAAQTGNNSLVIESDVTLTNVSIIGVTASGSPDNGGGISHTGGTLTLENVNFSSIGTLPNNPSAAIDSTAGILNMDDVVVNTTASTDGAIVVGGSSVIGIANQLNMFLNNTATGSNRGALTIDTTNTNPMQITRSAFSTNSGDSNVTVGRGNVSFVNSNFLNGPTGTGGLIVGPTATVNLSFVTIAGNNNFGLTNGGATFIRNTIIDDACLNIPPTLDLEGRNFIDSTCGPQFVTDPKITTQPGIAQYYTLDPDSPAIDRAGANCAAIGGGTVTVDYRGNERPERDTCDVGAYEREAATITAGDVIPPETIPEIFEETPGIIENITFTLDTFPVAPVEFSVENTSPAQCTLIDVNNNDTPTNPLTVTFNAGNWDTGISFGVRADQDTLREGDHPCEITLTYQPGNDPLYNETLVNNDPPPPVEPIPVVITIFDDDLVEQPGYTTDYSNFAVVGVNPNDTALYLEEGETGNQVNIRLNNPPENPVRVWVQSNDDQCSAARTDAFNSVVLDTSNWDDGQTIEIFAIDDGIQENTVQECTVVVVLQYTLLDNSTVETNDNSVILRIEPDPPLSLIVNPGILTVEEGQTEFVDLQLSRLIGPSSPDTYTVNFSDSPNCDILNADGNVISQLTLNNTNQGIVEIQVRPDDDNILNDPANQRTCLIAVTVDPANPNTTIDPVTIDVTIQDNEQDLPENAIVIVTEQENGDVLTDPGNTNVSTTLREGFGESLSFGVRLDREVNGNVTMTVREAEFQPNFQKPSGESIVNQQCGIRIAGQADLARSVSFNINDENEVGVIVEPLDDPVLEDDSDHFCRIEFLRRNPDATVSTFVVDYRINITDENDLAAVNTVPDMRTTAPAIRDDVGFTFITYIFTAPVTEQISFTYTSLTPSVCNPATTSFAIGGVPSSNGFFEFPVIINNVNADALCQITATWNPVPGGYPAGYDIPDIQLLVRDANVVDPPDDPTNTPQSGPTDVPSTPGVNNLQTAQPGITGTPLFEGTPLPTEVPVPSVALIAGVDRLPVRTGPYLGATFVTIAVRDTPSGEPEFYRVLARNNDEAEDVTWFRIVANGKVGWASGRSLELRNVTEEQLPVEGSIFDEIVNAPELGVPGLVTRDRAIYRRPSTRASTMGLIPAEAIVSILGRTREFPYDDWYQVRYGGQTGWVLSEIRQEDPAVLVNEDQVREIVPVR